MAAAAVAAAVAVGDAEGVRGPGRRQEHGGRPCGKWGKFAGAGTRSGDRRSGRYGRKAASWRPTPCPHGR